MQIEIRDLGHIDYERALALQLDLVAQRQQEKIGDTLLLLEHPPVITLGKSASENDILVPRSTLEAAGATVHRITRGGETTYHGPGQLVGYLIINLYEHQRSLKRFVYNLEQVFINLLSEEYGIQAGRDEEHRGVWVGTEKITAIGIAISHGVTMHGFAFNVNTDLSHFQWIIPCGITDRGQTSVATLLGRPVEMPVIKERLSRHFKRQFGYQD